MLSMLGILPVAATPAKAVPPGLPFLLLLEGAPLLLRTALCALSSLRDLLRWQVVNRRCWALAREGKWVRCCILSGNVGASERAGLWRHLAAVEELEACWCSKLAQEDSLSELPDGRQAFELLARRDLPPGKASEIERDVHRTFPTHPKFRAGDEGATARAQLLQVLHAAAAAEPGVGYCQGMNFVAATLLIHLSSPREAFWLLLAIIDGYHFRHVFAPGVPQLPLRLFQFSGVVRERLPKLWRHLREESFSLDIFAQQCVLTLFAYSIEPELLAHVYDAFLLLGWEVIFRLGTGLLASLEGHLLGMGIEEISRFLHQRKKHFDLGSAESRRLALEELLKFEVSQATLDDLQASFQLERWESLLKLAGDEQANGTSEPLPAGLERGAAADSFVLHISALSSGNLPPPQRRGFRRNGAPPGSAGRVSAWKGVPKGTLDAKDDGSRLAIPVETLRQLKAALDEYDAETQRDVASLRGRILDVGRTLDADMQSSETLRTEALKSEQERREAQDFKKAVMEALQAAVQTSSAVRPSGGMGRPGAAEDPLVMQCLQKLNRLESDIFEKSVRWQAKARELEPVAERLEELRDAKARAMAQLLLFIEVREAERRQRLKAGMELTLLLDPAA